LGGNDLGVLWLDSMSTVVVKDIRAVVIKNIGTIILSARCAMLVGRLGRVVSPRRMCSVIIGGCFNLDFCVCQGYLARRRAIIADGGIARV